MMNYAYRKLKCDTCKEVSKVIFDFEEVPEHIFIVHCNWCHNCEDKATDYYKEYWDEEENKPENIPIPVAPNQLNLFTNDISY